MKKIMFACLALLCSISAYAGSISLLSNSHGVASVPINKVTNIVNQYIDTNNYLNVKVQPIYKPNGKINYLLAYLPSRKTFSFSVTKIVVNDKYNVISVVQNYHLTKNDLLQQPNVMKANLTCPNPSVEFVDATPVSYTQGTMDAINKVYTDATSSGYKTVKLIDNDATVANYENYLSCSNLKGFFNIGHGSNNEILLSDGVLDYNFFQSQINLAEKTVVLFNSCEVFNDPLKPALINNAKAQKYAGGITNLYIGASQPASACFWHKAFQKQPMTSSLESCAKQYDPQDQFGIGGNGSDQLGNA